MGKGRGIRCYDYVNHPYDRVRDALSKDTLEVFQHATKAAASRARSVASELRVNVGGIEVGTDIAITVNKIEERGSEGVSDSTTHLYFEWEAAKSPRLFPFMQAELTIYSLTASETQLDFAGNYQPPLGAVGSAINALVGYRIAEVSVHRFVADVAQHLRTILAQARGSETDR